MSNSQEIMIEQENNKTIEEQEKDWVEIMFEVITLTIIAILAFVGGIYLLVKVIGRFIPFWFSGLAGPLLVVSFDIIWIIGMRKLRPKSNQLKIIKKIVSVVVLAFLTSVLALWCIGYLTRNMW